MNSSWKSNIGSLAIPFCGLWACFLFTILERHSHLRPGKEVGLPRFNIARSIALLLIAFCCISSHSRADMLIEGLKSRFDSSWQLSTYMTASVQTPQGLWNVYVVSIPPDQVAVRQSRQDGEYEYGLIDDVIWHDAFAKEGPVRLDDGWAWFIRNHEIFRFSEWLTSLKFREQKNSDAASADKCSLRYATDDFGLTVTLCLDPSGEPKWIERITPEVFGKSPVRVTFSAWDAFEGRNIPSKFTTCYESYCQDWQIEGLTMLGPGQSIRAPKELK